METIQTIVSQSRESIDKRILELISSDNAKPIDLVALEPVRYLCLSGGKRLRPVLLLLCCQALRGDPAKALNAAAAMEMIHAASLIFDDLIDQESTRRGKRAIHETFGKGKATAVGLYLASKSVQIVAAYRDERMDNRFGEALVQLSRGELMGVTVGGDADLETYLEIAKLKTSSLFMASASIGALLGGGTEGQADVMSEYGKFVGIAFQIRDDIIDMPTGNTGSEQKPLEGSEPLLFTESDQANCLSKHSEFRLTVDSAKQLSHLFADKARFQLRQLNIPGDHTKLLDDFADYAWERNV